ncbi:hypothetical protein [Aeromicrobium sp. A1-2]|nr:hypothetical protein [Aeromicrobium sp. A1-2]
MPPQVRLLMTFRESESEGDHAPMPAILGAVVQRYEVASTGPA